LVFDGFEGHFLAPLHKWLFKTPAILKEPCCDFQNYSQDYLTGIWSSLAFLDSRLRGSDGDRAFSLNLLASLVAGPLAKMNLCLMVFVLRLNIHLGKHQVRVREEAVHDQDLSGLPSSDEL
jgi:hypothetical protein